MFTNLAAEGNCETLARGVLAGESWQKVGSSVIIKRDLIAYWIKQKQHINMFHTYRQE